jgi:hypothetical protein
MRKYARAATKAGKRYQGQTKTKEIQQEAMSESNVEPVSRKFKVPPLPRSATKQVDVGCGDFEEGSIPVFPAGRHSYLAINSDPRAFYIDKTSFIPHLERIADAVVLLAPRRFGKSLLLDTLACYYDISRAEKFEEDFGKRWIGQVDEFEHNGTKEVRPRKTDLANKFYVLRLDFSCISQANSYEGFNKNFNDLINAAIVLFCDSNSQTGIVLQKKGSFSQPIDKIAMKSFEALCDYLEVRGMRLMILIDEYDNFLNSVIGNKQFARDPEELKKMEFTFKSFFANIKSRLGANLRVFIAGVTPMVLSMYTGGFNVGYNNLQDPLCPNLFGFTESDVKEGLKLLNLSPNAQNAVFNLLKELHNGYRFHSTSPDTLFNPTRIQFILSQVAEFMELTPNSSLSNVQARIRAAEDPNTKPAEAVLHLLSSNPHTFNIVTDCIDNPNGISWSTMKTINYQIRPSSMAEVDELSMEAIISWMFFNGALTYAKRNSEDEPLSFVVPNLIARKEFIDEFLKSSAQDVHQQLQAALSSLLDAAEPSVDPFLRQIESSVLASAQGHDVKDQEQALHKVLLTCLTLCKRPMDKVVSEYLVKPNNPGSKDGHSADVVYHSSSENGKKRFVFELKNVPVEYWKEKPSGNPKWSQIVDAARSVVYKSDAELCNLEWRPHDLRTYIPVQQTIDEASNQLKGYLMEMRKQDLVEGPSIGFVIVRVGLFRLISQRVTIK